MKPVKGTVPKGWIILDVLCEASELTEEQKAELEIQRLVKGDDEVEKNKWTSESTVFRKSLIQVINIGSIDLETDKNFLIKGNAFVLVGGKYIEVKQQPLEIVAQIEYDKYDKPDRNSIPNIKE